MQIHIAKADITEMAVDAIVNPANSLGIMGGGVAGALSRKSGPSIHGLRISHPPRRRASSVSRISWTHMIRRHGLVVGLILFFPILGCKGHQTALMTPNDASRPADLGASPVDGSSIPIRDAPHIAEASPAFLPDSSLAVDSFASPDLSGQADTPSLGDTPTVADGNTVANSPADAPSPGDTSTAADGNAVANSPADAPSLGDTPTVADGSSVTNSPPDVAPSLLSDSASGADAMDRPSETDASPGFDSLVAVDSPQPVDSTASLDVAGACAAESDSAFCVRTGKACGSVVGVDNCGQTRSVDCGQCAAGESCDSTHQCVCVPESTAAVCTRWNKVCGTFSGTDNCGIYRTVGCGTCGTGLQCGPQNQCERDCDAGACETICAADSDCGDAGTCVDASCVERKQLGAACSDGNTCASGHCVDGVCCNLASCSPSDGCSAASCTTGTCTTVDRAACALSACELVAASCPALDSDGDGFSDAWETNGYVDVNCNGIEEAGDVALPGADPNVPDIYVLYDWMELQGSGAACATAATCAVDETCTAGHCTGHTHDPEALAPGGLDAVAAQFTARGLNLHVIRGHARPHSHIASFRTPTANCEGADVAPGTLGAYAVNLDDLKNAAPFPFDHAYDRINHYMLFAHDSACDSDAHCAACPETYTPGATGQAEILGNNAMVSLGMLLGELTCLDDKKFLVGGTFMHELGHNLGLHHGGGANPLPCERDADCAALGPDHTGETCQPWGSQSGTLCLSDSSCVPPERCRQGKCGVLGCVHVCTHPSDCTSLGPQHVGESCESGICLGNFAEDLPGFKPNYLSVMNYRYQFVGIHTDSTLAGACPNGGRRLDYAVQVLPTGGNTPYKLDETQLNEPDGLGSGNSDYFTFMNGRCSPRRAPANGPVDWDGDGEATNTAATADLNPNEDVSRECGDVEDEVHLGHADWGWAPGRSMFSYRFQCTPHLAGASGSAGKTHAHREQTIAEAKQHGMLLHDRTVDVSVRPDHRHSWNSTSSWSEVPVVVYGAADFDVEDIDPSSIRLGRAFAEGVSLSDVDGDGFADLVATFVVAKTGLKPNSRASMFTARLKSSQILYGSDAVVLLPSEPDRR